MTRIFKINEKIEVVCRTERTQRGFRHVAELMIKGEAVDKQKICYLNRTWERFEYQSVLKKLFKYAPALSEDEKKLCNAFAEGDQTDWRGFETVAMVAKMGDIFCDNQKEKNDWKARMLKAGLENQGLIMPEDWDQLDENEKQRRLDGVISIMKKEVKA